MAHFIRVELAGEKEEETKIHLLNLDFVRTIVQISTTQSVVLFADGERACLTHTLDQIQSMAKATK